MSKALAAGALAALLASSPVALAQEGSAPAPQPAPSPSSSAPPQPGAGAPASGQAAPSQPPSSQQGTTGAAGSADAEQRALEEQISKELGAAPSKAGSAAQPPSAQPPPQPGAAGAQPQGGATGTNPYARLLMLPDVSAIGDFALAYDQQNVEKVSPRPDPFGPPERPQPLFQELELGLQSVIDPYARADVFISFHPGGVDVEEAYLTTLSLPAGLQVRAGQFFSPFGRLNQQHPHVWDFVSAPLAQTRVLAGDVLSGPGADLAWLTPLPWFAEVHLDFQATAPLTPFDQPTPGNDQERLTGIVRLLQYVDAGEATTVGVGLSGGLRGEGAGVLRQLGGADAFVKIRPPESRAYLALQGEVFARRFTGGGGGSAWGAYAQAFWRANPFFGYGVRYDRAPAAGEAPPGPEQRLSAIASWFLTEFQKLRLEAGWDRLPGGKSGAEALLQVELAIGAHGAHPF